MKISRSILLTTLVCSLANVVISSNLHAVYNLYDRNRLHYDFDNKKKKSKEAEHKRQQHESALESSEKGEHDHSEKLTAKD
jgi:hypothetical protein